MSAAALAERIDALVAALPQPGGVRGAIVRVEVPGFEHASAAGLGRADTGEAVTVDHRFHVASVGKMFTATLVLQAAEAGLFGPKGIDTSLGELAFAPRELVEGVHPTRADDHDPPAAHPHERHEGHADRRRQRHRRRARPAGARLGDGQLLEVGSWARGRGPVERVRAAPMGAVGSERRRRPDGGHAQPLPRDRHRSDAGRRVRASASTTATRPTCCSACSWSWRPAGRYAELQRERISDPLGLADTTLAYHENGHDDAGGDAVDGAGVTSGPAPCDGAGVMDVWLGDIALLSAGLDLSFDWGGGGQVSTVADLCRFLRGLLAGELFDDPATIAASHDLGAPGSSPAAAARGGAGSVPLAGRGATS